MTERQLWDIAAEQVTRGGLWSPQVLADVRDSLAGPEVFARPAHQALWAVLVARADVGEPTDPVAVWDVLAPNRIPGVDGSYLHTLVAACPVPANAIRTADRVARLARLRDWQQLTTAILDRVNSPDADADEIDAYGWARIEEACRAQQHRDADRQAARAGYAYATLRDQVNQVLRAGPDTNERVLRRAAGCLAGLMTAALLPRDVAIEALTRAGYRVGLDATCTAAAIATGLSAAPTRRTTRHDTTERTTT